MNRPRKSFAVLFALALAAAIPAFCRADNPLIMDQFTADPTARLFNGKIYLYPSHDIPASRGARGQAGFAMEDYHVFSTDNLIQWKDGGVLMNQTQVPWVRGQPNSMWAPDCVERDGKFYFYFPASNQIGVAVADKPEGPFTIEPTPIVGGIDPCCFIDSDKYEKDVAAAKEKLVKDPESKPKPEEIKPDVYLVWKGAPLTLQKLKDDMKTLDPAGQRVNVQLPNVPAAGGAPIPATTMVAAAGGGRGGGGGNANGLIEGPFLFARKGKYYLTYPHAIRTAGFESEALEYAMADAPLGPYKVVGTIMDQSPSKCWTNHHSLVEFQGQWILFYHDKDLSPTTDKNRSVRADYLQFNDDGTIKKVIPTLRGVGVADAKNKIQIDRYSAVSEMGAKDEYMDPKQPFDGWKITLSEKDAWVKYDRVDFGKDPLKAVNVRSLSTDGGKIEVHLDKADGPLLAQVEIPKATLGEDGKPVWGTIKTNISNAPTGQHDLIVTMPQKNEVQVDWVSFE